jgi:Bacterial translation initiation factor IF-2 associated region
VLVAIFAERESHAAWFLSEQNMTHQDTMNFIVREQGMVRQSFSHGRTKPVVVQKIKRRTAAPKERKRGGLNEG